MPETDQFLYSRSCVIAVFESFSSRILYISISKVRVHIFKIIKEVKNGTMWYSGLFFFTLLPRRVTNKYFLYTLVIGRVVWGHAPRMPISGVCISPAVFQCLYFIICLHHKLLSVLSAIHQTDTDRPDTDAHLFQLSAFFPHK